MYYDMSTVLISSTAAAAASSLVSTAIMTNTPSPTSNIEPPDMEEMESNAVLMAFNNLTLQQVSYFAILTSLTLRLIVDATRRHIVEHNSERVH